MRDPKEVRKELVVNTNRLQSGFDRTVSDLEELAEWGDPDALDLLDALTSMQPTLNDLCDEAEQIANGGLSCE